MEIPLNIDWRQILLHIFNLAILIGGLYFLLYSPVKRFMEKREAYYRHMDEEAEQRLRSAEAMEQKAKQTLDGLEQEIAGERLRAEAELRDRTNRRLQEAQDQADRILSDAQKSAQAEKQAILERVDRDIVAMTKEATAKILHEHTDEAYEAFLALAERDMNDEK